MDEKRRGGGDTGSPLPSSTTSAAPSIDSPSTEPPPPRRRGQKRKSTSSNTSGGTSSSSAPPKRHAREKAAAAAAAAAAGISALLPPFHNGPLTRARQLSDNNAVLNAVKDEMSNAAVQDPASACDGREEANLVKDEEFDAIQAVVEAEFDKIRSRDVNSHVVPVAAGWFSWTEIHPLEKQTLRSFFSGKSESRTPVVYLEIRNWIMKKFHYNPSTNLEVNDLLELSVGDLNARQEVLEFLDHWGLINYHPSLQNDSAIVDADPNTKVDTAEGTDLLVEKLYQFENEQSYRELAPRANMASQTMPTGLFRESALADEFIRQEGPAVEYHCNSCSADCSRKRYHCQKQADFDLCTECYNNEKFGSGMSSSDFILMEPGEASGASSGKWTDQETLLLLEALELFKENWNEIAEHVATKTKAQCILHFLQMPIEDGFLDSDDKKDGVKVMADPISTANDSSVDKDSSEVKAGKDNADQTESGFTVGNSGPIVPKSDKDEPDSSERKTDANAAQPAPTPMETSNQEEVQLGKVTHDEGDDLVLTALQDAFDAVGCPVTPEDNICLIDAGNPVMALAAFLNQLVQPTFCTASARGSIKSISSSSPGSQLAARHCFILEDPPDHKKEQTVSESNAAEKIDQIAEKLSNLVGENDKEVMPSQENPTPMDEQKDTQLLDNSHPIDGQLDDKKGSNLGDSAALLSEGKDVCAEKLDQEMSQVVEEPDPEKSKVVERPDVGKSQIEDKSDEGKLQSEDKLDEKKSEAPEKDDEDKSQATVKPDHITHDELAGPKVANDPPNGSLRDDQSNTNPKSPDGTSKVLLHPSSGDESGKAQSEVVVLGCTNVPKDVDLSSNINVSGKTEQQGTVLADPAVGVGSQTGEDKMEVDKSDNSKPVKTDRIFESDNVSRLKRAALATLSAAAVKAKLLANQEEDEIKQLATLLIEKQLRKLEIKLSFFTEMESGIMRVREQLERSRQKLFVERHQIIASRLGLPPSARGMLASHPLNRMPASLLNSLRPTMNMAAQRPPMPRPDMLSAPPTTNTSAPSEVAGGSAGQSTTVKSTPVGTS